MLVSLSWGWQSSNLCGPPPAAQTCTSKASIGLRLGHFAKPLREIVGGKPLAGLEPTRGWQRPSSGESGGEGWPRVPGVAFGRGRCQLEDGIGLWPFVAAEVYSVSQSGVRKGDRATRLWQGERGQSRERRGSGHTPVAGSKGSVEREKGIGPHACGRVKGSVKREKGIGPHACGRVTGFSREREGDRATRLW